jgi:hypothetical protein
MVGCRLLLSIALFVIARRPAIIDDVALVSPAASAFVDLWSQCGCSHCRHRHGWRRGPVSGHEAVVEDQLVLQR